MRRFGEPPCRNVRYQARPGAYGVILRGRRMLVTEQADPGPELQLPGGGVDPGEGVVAALHREAREETGWRLAVRRRIGVYQRFVYMPEYDMWARKLCHIYLCAPGTRMGAPTEPGHRAVWMDAERAIAALAVDGDAHFAWLAWRGRV